MTNTKLIGAKALLPLKMDPRNSNTELSVRVVICDVRENFGRVDCKVAPIDGTGETWVRLATLKGVKYAA